MIIFLPARYPIPEKTKSRKNRSEIIKNNITGRSTTMPTSPVGPLRSGIIRKPKPGNIVI